MGETPWKNLSTMFEPSSSEWIYAGRNLKLRSTDYASSQFSNPFVHTIISASLLIRQPSSQYQRTTRRDRKWVWRGPEGRKRGRPLGTFFYLRLHYLIFSFVSGGSSLLPVRSAPLSLFLYPPYQYVLFISNIFPSKIPLFLFRPNYIGR